MPLHEAAPGPASRRKTDLGTFAADLSGMRAEIELLRTQLTVALMEISQLRAGSTASSPAELLSRRLDAMNVDEVHVVSVAAECVVADSELATAGGLSTASAVDPLTTGADNGAMWTTGSVARVPGFKKHVVGLHLGSDWYRCRSDACGHPSSDEADPFFFLNCVTGQAVDPEDEDLPPVVADYLSWCRNAEL